MTRTKKQPVEEVEVSVEEPVAEVTQEVTQEVTEPQFPYKLRLPSLSMTVTVVAESVDAQGRALVHTADGCVYHK